MVVGGQAGRLHHRKGVEGGPGEGAEGAEAVLLLLVGTRAGVAELGSQLPAVGEEGEGQQNRGEVGKRGVKVVVGSLEIQILQVGVEVGCPWPEVEAEGPVEEQSRVWGPAESPEESPEEELVVGGWG